MNAVSPVDSDSDTRVLTIEEAAEILRIGRTAAYDAARRWRESGGAEGLPVLRIGRRLRVPRDAFERLLSGAIPETNDA